MKLLLTTSLAITINMIYTHHPIMIMLLVITQTLIICFMLWHLSPTAWFSFILFLIFIGGLMVLFIYITSLAANETFDVKTKISKAQLALTTALIVAYFSLSLVAQGGEKPTSTPLIEQMSLTFSGLLPHNTMVIMTYLLVTLIIVIKISTKNNSPIRNLTKQL